jgi:hypothetical protein
VSSNNTVLPSACTQITLPSGTSKSKIQAAAATVLALYPNYINITLQVRWLHVMALPSTRARRRPFLMCVRTHPV